MSIDFEQKRNIIFLISQPRAGSTLTQKIIGKHANVYTFSEPWIMLHPLYALRDSGYEADYDARLYRIAVKDFVSLLPNQEQDYFDAISEGYGRLYRKILEQNQKSYFLDKTPRYYHIIPELFKVFPHAKFIILFRNPLAVLHSILTTWVQDQLSGLKFYKHDILTAPQLLVDGIKIIGDRVVVLHYEKMLQNPEEVMSRVFREIDIEFNADLVNYRDQADNEKWYMGDPKSIHNHIRPSSEPAIGWLRGLDSPQIWRLLNEYLEFLGREMLERMGYDYSVLRSDLDKQYPGKFSLLNTVSLSYLLSESRRLRSEDFKYYAIRLMGFLKGKYVGIK